MRSKPACIGLASLGLFFCTVSAHALDVAQSARLALQASPAVQAARADAGAAAQGVRLARANRYPTLDLRLAGGREDTRYEAPLPAPLNRSVRESDLDRQEASLTARQVLFSGFSVSATIDARDAEYRATLARLDAQRTRVALESSLAHLEVAAARDALAAAQDQVAAHERTLAQVESRLAQGVGQRVDVEQARSRQSRARQLALQRQQALARAEAKYRRFTGADADAALGTSLPAVDVPRDVPAGLERAQAQRAEMNEAKARVVSAEAQATAARAGNYPELSLELSRNRMENLDGTEAINSDTTAMATLRYNLYRGGGDLARRRAAASGIDAARERLRDTEWQVRQEVSVAVAGLAQAESALPEAEARAAAIAAVVDSYEAQFNLGRRSLLDVLDAVSESYDARQAAIQARIDVAAARLQVLAATGSLLAAVGDGQETTP